MSHDFMDCHPGDERFCVFDGSKCTDQGGVMDYNQVSLQLGALNLLVSRALK